LIKIFTSLKIKKNNNTPSTNPNNFSSSKAPANTPSWIYVPQAEAHRLAVSQDAVVAKFIYFLFFLV
jgi:hypothetical protein